MDTSATVATWLSLGVTFVGLCGLITQANAILDNIDPFHATRTVAYLGVWFQRQKKLPGWRLVKPPPDGPVLSGQLAVAFCGRKPAGHYVLQHQPRGFPGAHGSRHLYNMLGGRVYDVDFLFARPDAAARPAAPLGGQVDLIDVAGIADIELTLPSTTGGLASPVFMRVPPAEQAVLQRTLDSLPWPSLSWSIHRGLRDMLVAYARPVMDVFRADLAATVERFVHTNPEALEARGWQRSFVRGSMGAMAASAVLAREGNSGDLVRVVTEIVLAVVQANVAGPVSEVQLDATRFWQLPADERKLDDAGLLAMTKVFAPEWSNEFDYQLYHHLPIELYFG